MRLGPRYKLCHGRGAADPVALVHRPFAGLANEADWVALREIVPAATAPLQVRPEFAPEGAALTAMAATVLPLAWPGAAPGRRCGLGRAAGRRCLGRPQP